MHPAIQLLKSKAVFPALYRHIDQLYRGTLRADRRIQRWSEYRSEHHIHSITARSAQKVFNDFPMAFTEHVRPIINGQTVAVEPLCKGKPLCR